jgi:ribosomal-protein-alanine N-acetyltransferase
VVFRSAPAVLIERMCLEDLPHVLHIEVGAFSLPWTRDMFECDLDRPDIADMLVARLPGHGAPPPIAGYLCAYLLTDEVHINNLAVDARWRRRGVARALLQAALDRGRLQGATRAFLEVRMSNAGAQSLYRSFGFRDAGIRRHYYTQPVEDALVMELRRL